MTEARLVDTAVPSDPRGIVLVLHGGAARRRTERVSAAQLSVLRMVPVAARIAREAPGRLVVQRLLNSHRGWAPDRPPVADLEWAIARSGERFGSELPVCLVGHSLGGRAALLAAGHPQVRSIVALAPWLYPEEGRGDLGDKRVLIVHGDEDKVALPQNSAALARHLARHVASTGRVGYVTVTGGRHAMLRHHAVFEGLAAQFAAATLVGAPARGVIARVLAGEQWVAV